MGLLDMFRRKKPQSLPDGSIQIPDRLLGDFFRATGMDAVMKPCRCPKGCLENGGVQYYGTAAGKPLPRCKVCGSEMKPV